eukprot:CAMPEP_0194494584 /NCGR_PEP_ID=MMETSP0253-20130528/12450_1 /TAXON_ID=2966 /ORGANISM="Noctiluca scintillans" /LENGTH=53 /DNA_ID=CAMNT_0039335723 /DNA_START=107 /DNA_END=264 /DNA_ORIENTATION=+
MDPSMPSQPPTVETPSSPETERSNIDVLSLPRPSVCCFTSTTVSPADAVNLAS